MLKSDLIGTHRTDLNSNGEIIWVNIKIQGTKDIIIGAFYRSPQFGNPSEYMHELRESINKIKHSNKEHIWLGGDFNLLDKTGTYSAQNQVELLPDYQKSY